MLGVLGGIKDAVVGTPGFLWRHKKKLAVGVVATVGVGAYWGYRKSVNAVQGIQDEMQREMADKHKERVSKDCDDSVVTFLPELQRRTKKLVAAEAMTKEVKEMAAKKTASQEEKMAVWDKLKIECFTSAFTGVYSFGMLVMVLRVQLHILGRRTFEERDNEVDLLSSLLAGSNPLDLETGSASSRTSTTSSSSPPPLSESDRHQFLSVSCEHMLGEGLQSLVEDIRAVVTEEMSSWSVTTMRQVSEDDLRGLWKAVRAKLEAGHQQQQQQQQHMAAKYCVQDRTGSLTNGVRALLDETWDVIESPPFADAMTDCLDALFDLLLSRLNGRLYPRKKPSTAAAFSAAISTDADGGEAAAAAAEAAAVAAAAEEPVVLPPLAKVLPNVRAVAGLTIMTTKAGGGGTGGGRVGMQNPEFLKAVTSLPRVVDMCSMVFHNSDVASK